MPQTEPKSHFSLLQSCKRYWRTTTGTIAIMFAFMAPIIVGSAGFALDYAQAYLVQQRLIQALDAAALAGASSSTNAAEIESKIKQFFEINYPEEAFGFTFEPEVQIVGDKVYVTGRAFHSTTFLRVMGITEINLETQTVVNREVRGIEVALVLDVTGSMQGAAIQSLRDATNTFIDTIFARVSDPRFLKIGLVPYSVTINVGSIAPQIVDKPYVPGRPNVKYDPSKPRTEWAGCVMARETPHDIYDSSIFDGGKWKAYWWEHTTGDTIRNFWDPAQGGTTTIPYVNNPSGNDMNNHANPNLGCPLTDPILPLTSNKTLLKERAAALRPWHRGGTLGNLGMTWGWHVLSDQEPFTEGAPYDSFLWRKAVVMMTDGENQLFRKPNIKKQSDYSSYGYIDDNVLGTKNTGVGRDIVNERFVQTCEAMKELGITIHTVVFGTAILNRPTEEYYKQCASSPNHHHRAASGSDLVKVYEDIARELSNLHISQ